METPALLLIHGYPFDHSLWDYVVSSIGTGIHLLAPDLRGFGGQPIGSVEPSIERMADDLKELLDRHNISRSVVAGMSMGGYVALAFAERHPDHLTGLALVSSQATADTDEARANRRAMIDRVKREGPGAAAQAIIPKLFARRNVGRPEFVRYPTASAEKAGTEGIVWALEAMARRPDRTHVVKSARVPVVVIHGTEDQFTPATRARELASLAADGRFIEIPNAGHATPLEAPAVVAEALQDLVRRSFTDRALIT